MLQKIKMALIGCGRISNNHLSAISDLKERIELVAVCDHNIERAKTVADTYNCNYYGNINELVAKEKLDVVALATPNGMHSSQIIFFAQHGINIISEKPLSITFEDGLKAVDECKKNNVKLFLIHQNRFNDPVQRAFSAIQNGRFGKIYMITSNVFWQRPQEYYDKDASWHGTKALDGGAFMTQASHYVDMVQWLAQSEPTSIYSVLGTLGRNIETEDTGSAIINFKNGIISSINVTMLTYPKNMEGSITIIGEKGTVRIGGVAMNKIEHWEFKDELEDDASALDLSYNTASVYGFGHVRNYQDILQDLHGEKTALINADEALKSLRILDSILKSNASQKPIVF